MSRRVVYVILCLLVPLSGCDLLDQFSGGPTEPAPKLPFFAVSPYHIVGEIEIFYGGPIPLRFEPDASIQSAEDAIGAQIKVTDVFEGGGIAVGDSVVAMWITDVAPPDAPCFEWDVGPEIFVDSVVEVRDTGSFCDSYIRAFLLP